MCGHCALDDETQGGEAGASPRMSYAVVCPSTCDLVAVEEIARKSSVNWFMVLVQESKKVKS